MPEYQIRLRRELSQTAEVIVEAGDIVEAKRLARATYPGDLKWETEWGSDPEVDGYFELMSREGD